MRNKALGRIISEETKKKMSLARLGYKFSDAVLEKLKGKKFTAEHKAKISKALIGRGFSEERLKNHIIQVTKLKGVKLTVTDIQTGNIEKFDSITLAANNLKASRSAIENCISKNTLFRKKYQITRDS
jgi:group I intron endonuclease